MIIDDHPLFREGLKTIIASDPNYEVVGEAGTARKARRLIKDLEPDLVLMDLVLPDRSGIDLTAEIHSRLPKTRIMVISMHSKVDYIVKAFKAGATGYMIKESAVEKLMFGIASVLNGEYFMDGSVSHRVVKKLMEAPQKGLKIKNAAYETLTPREQEILVLLAEGLSSKEIAEKLYISPKTVENHRTNIMNKLDIHTIHGLIRFATKLGLIDVDLWKD